MRRNPLTSFSCCSLLAWAQARPTARRVASRKSMSGRTFSSASLSALSLSPAARGLSLVRAVERGAVAPGEPGGLGDVAPGDLEDPHQVVALEGAARLIKGRERGVGHIDGLAHERLRDHLGCGKGDRLLDHIQKLAHV